MTRRLHVPGASTRVARDALRAGARVRDAIAQAFRSDSVNSRRVVVVRSRMPQFAKPANVISRRPTGARRARGFTLIEIVVAFSILAVGLGIAMQIATGAMRQSRSAADYTEAALYAQSLLDNVGVGERLEEGESSGEFNDRFQWSLRSEAYEIETESPLDTGIAPVELYRLELLVSWQRGRNTQEARFVTLRALTPDM
jgi:general secretion pathway protein I